MIQSLGTVMLWLAGAGFIVFILGFGLFAAWQSSAMGRHVMAFMTTLGIVVVYAMIRSIGIFNGHSDVARLIIWTAVAGVVWWRVLLFGIIQWRFKNEKRKRALQ